jgi:hypothetical protein
MQCWWIFDFETDYTTVSKVCNVVSSILGVNCGVVIL